jgi:hypothetical protein
LGAGGVPDDFFDWNPDLEAHAKFQNPTTTYSGRKVRKRRREEEN